MHSCCTRLGCTDCMVRVCVCGWGVPSSLGTIKGCGCQEPTAGGKVGDHELPTVEVNYYSGLAVDV